MSHRHASDRLVATHNSGKLRELLAPYAAELVKAGELGLAESEETSTTFAASAPHWFGAAALRHRFVPIA